MADSDSGIAWHRAQIKRLREALRDFESGKAEVAKTDVAKAPGSKRNGRARDAIADIKRKIRQSEQIVDLYERRNTRRPRGTDSQSLASVRGS